MKRLTIITLFLLSLIETVSAQTEVSLLFPEQNYQFRKGQTYRVRWSTGLSTTDDSIDYHLTIKEVLSGQTPEQAMEENSAVYSRSKLGIRNRLEQSSLFGSVNLQTHYVWQVEYVVYSGGSSVTNYSPLGLFYTPLIIEIFYAGNRRIVIDSGGIDLSNYSGRGVVEAMFTDTIENRVPVEINNVSLRESSGIYYLESGNVIQVDTLVNFSIKPRELGFSLDTGNLSANPFYLTSNRVSFDAEFSLDLGTIGINDTLIASGEISITSFYIYGGIYQSSKIKFSNNLFSQNIVIDSSRVQFNQYGSRASPIYGVSFRGTSTNDYLKKAKDSTLIEYTWQSENQLNYLELENDDRDTLALFSELGTSFRLGSAILDMNDTMSHESKPKEWKGLLSNRIDIIQDGQLTQYDSVGLFSVDSSGMHLEISYGLSQERTFAQIPYSHGFDSVSYSLQGAGVVSGALFGSIESELYAEDPIELFYTIDSSKMSMFPNMILGDDTLVFSAPYIEEPFDIYGDSVSLVWYNMGEQFTYQIDISKDTFKTFEDGYENFVVEDSTVQLIGLDPLTTYQYRIRAYNGETLYSKTPEELIFSFTTGEEIEIVILSEEFKTLTLYPNPTKGLLHLEQQNLSGAYEYNVFDLTGRKVLTRGSIKDSALDISSLSKGVYVIQVLQNEKEITRQRVIKE